MSGKSKRARVLRRDAPREPEPFTCHDDLLETARQMFRARRQRMDTESEDSPDRKKLKRRRHQDQLWSRFWHRSLLLTDKEIHFAGVCRCKRLNRIEREILVALVLDRLALMEQEAETCGEVLRVLGLQGKQAVQAMRNMSEDGRLVKSGLVAYEDPEEDLRDRDLVADPVLVQAVLDENGDLRLGWPVKTEAELHRRLSSLTRVLHTWQDELDSAHRGYGYARGLFRARRKVELLLRGLRQTLKLHPNWKFSALFTSQVFPSREAERLIVLALVGKELGHLHADDDLFEGGGLARAVSKRVEDIPYSSRLLMSDGALLRRDLIQACGGSDPLLTDNPSTLAEVEFELTSRCLELLGLQKRVVKQRQGGFHPREAQVRLDQLALSPDVREVVDLSMAQVRGSKRLFDDWGLSDVLPYGRSVSLLFWGPPGVGKTACAEGMAHELERPILVVDYSQIQNCYIGVTEKNIVRIFREARARDAVLFWDEADAMFFDRDLAHSTWEVRDVNVLLQELERFEGLCILATNRKLSLDPALERRISLKVEFKRPDRKQRLCIWRKLLPGKLPLAGDVQCEWLAAADFSGGEIKNAVLNAARLALRRGENGPVTRADFEQAIKMERDGRWNPTAESRLGFRA